MKKVPVLSLAVGGLLLIGAVLFRPALENGADEHTAGASGDSSQAEEGLRIRAQIQNDPVAPTFAGKDADVTLVVFSDYQCPFCRKVHPALEQLLREDHKVKVVYRDWPIFGAGSVEAARVAIASQYQGKHAAFNNAMMEIPGRVTSQSVRAAADKAGVDWTRLQADLEARADDIDGALDRTSSYAAMMGLSGTPGMLVGPYLIPGAIDLAGLRRAVALARENPTGASAMTEAEHRL